MSLKNKRRIYISFDEKIAQFLEERAIEESCTKSKIIFRLLKQEYEKHTKKKIYKVIEGGNIDIDIEP